MNERKDQPPFRVPHSQSDTSSIIRHFTAFRRAITRRGLKRNAVASLLEAMFGLLALATSFALIIAFHGREALGLWSLLIGLTALLRLLDFSGGSILPRLVAVAVGRDDEGQVARVVDTVTLIVIVLYIALAFGGTLFINETIPRVVELKYQSQAQDVLPWIIAGLFIQVVGRMTLGALDGLQRADLRSMISVIASSTFVVTTVIFVHSLSILALAIGQIIQGLVLLIGGRFILIRMLPEIGWVPKWFDRKVIVEAISYGSRLQLVTFAALVSDPVVRVIFNHYGGLEQVARYEIAWRVVGYAREAVMAASTPLIAAFARMSEMHGDDRRRLLKETSKWLGASTGVVFVLIALGSPLISLTFFQEIDVVFLLMLNLVIPGQAIASQAVVLERYATGTGYLRWVIAGQVVRAITAITFTIVIGQALGGDWIIGGVTLSLAIGALVSLVGNIWNTGETVHDALDLRTALFSICMPSAVAIAVIAFWEIK